MVPCGETIISFFPNKVSDILNFGVLAIAIDDLDLLFCSIAAGETDCLFGVRSCWWCVSCLVSGVLSVERPRFFATLSPEMIGKAFFVRTRPRFPPRPRLF